MTGIPLDVDKLSALDQLSAEMGFDRGELLTLTRRLLFVEGRADQKVLEALFGPELRRLGARVIPMQGTGRLHRVIEAEVLFRVTAAPIHVLLDNDVAGAWSELRADPEALERTLRDKRASTELKAVAQLLKTARMNEREADIELMSIPAPDMFFMLDEGILTELYPEYPGHERAERDWGEQNLPRKRFREERYGVPDGVWLYAQVATIMRERAIVPEPLAGVVRQLN